MRVNVSASRRIRSAVVTAATLSSVAACARAARETPRSVPPAVVAADTTVVRSDSARRDTVVVVDTAVKDTVAQRDTVARVDTLRPRTDSAPRVPVRRARPARECLLDMNNSPPESRLVAYTYPDGTRNVFVGGGFVGQCQGQNNTIRADSAEYLETAGIVNLYGNVDYSETGKLDFRSHRANYFLKEERLYAEGDVVATQLATGSTFRGHTMEYFRDRPGIRDQSRLYAPGRPTVTLVESVPAGHTPPPPVIIQANIMEDRGDSVIYAWGAVFIDRGTIKARSDSSSYDKVRNQSRLIRGARVESVSADQPFTLTGDTVEMYNRERELERVIARHQSRAVNGDLELTAETLDLRLAAQRLERAFAFGKGRAQAHTPQQDLDADSLAIYMQDQRVRELHAIGTAVAMGVPDTLRIRSNDRDMLRADTVYARFDTTAPPGTNPREAKIREIEAIGNATSLFQIASRRGPAFPPAINYARGRTIRIMFDSGVSSVQVDSNASGIFLEPVNDSLSDTLSDSVAVSRRTPPRRPPFNRRSFSNRAVRHDTALDVPRGIRRSARD